MYRYNLFDNYKITQTQHGYKNKSFHTGKIDFDTKSLNYIYDCGLNRNELRIYFSEHNEKIDLIYVSHYDLDHLSGIINLFNMSEFSSLLSSTKVILPYFNDQVIFFPILFRQENELNDGFSENESISDREFLEFIFSDRIIWVNDNDYYYLNEGNVFDLNSGFIQNSRSNIILPRYNNVPLNWMFLSYVARDFYVLRELTECLRNIAHFDELVDVYRKEKSPQNALALIERIRPELRNHNVTSIMGSDRKLGNLISLALYSGPILTRHNLYMLRAREERLFRNLCTYFENFNTYFFEYSPFSDKCAWLHTGDANLKEESLYEDFINFFRSFIDNVGMLTVPHHGSASSFNQKLLNYTNCYFIITENYRARKDAMLEDNTSDKILLVNDEQGFELETISNNIDFRSRLKRIGV